MPLQSYHACRIRDPDDFDPNSYRTMHRSHEGNEYMVIVGKLRGSDTMTEQAYRYQADKWTEAQARAHCASHNGRMFEPASEQEHMDVVRHASYSLRSTMLDGRRHLVLPVVMMVEGVHVGSHGAIYHPAEELARFVAAWNGIPVTVGHPTTGTANLPNALERDVVGRVFNARYDNGKLRAEAWIDEQRAARYHGQLLAYLHAGRPIDVSVGVWADEVPQDGVWNGENYWAIARNYRPDHLALLPGEAGACSWADGCGVRIYQAGGSTEMDTIETNALKYNGTESIAWDAPTLEDFNPSRPRWEDLPREERAKIAAHYLIGDASAETFQDLKLPVVNPKTGRLNERALRAVIGGRGAQVKGVRREELARARRAAYRLLNEEFDTGLEIPDNLSQQEAAEMSETRECCKEMIDELLAATQGILDNSDKSWLEIQDQQTIERIGGVIKALASQVASLTRELEAMRNSAPRADEWMQALPQELKQKVELGLRMYEERTEQCVQALLNSARGVYTEDELRAKGLDELEKLCRVAKPQTDYSPLAAGAMQAVSTAPAGGAMRELMLPIVSRRGR